MRTEKPFQTPRSDARRSLCRFIAAASFLAALSTHAACAQSERLAYTLMLGGLHVGDGVVSLDQTPGGYKTTMKVIAAGALHWVKNFHATMQGEGTLVQASAPTGQAEMTPLPSIYKRQWSAGDFAELMTMNFDPATRLASTEDRIFNPTTGATLTHEDLPWNGRSAKFRPVPPNLRTNVFDPMAAFMVAREQLMLDGDFKRPRSFTVPVYDGSRRYDIVGKTQPVRAVNINGVDHDVVPVTGKLVPVFGFTKESEEKFQDIEGKIYFTPDARFIPVQMVVSGTMLPAVMNLAADCSQDAATCTALDKAAEEP